VWPVVPRVLDKLFRLTLSEYSVGVEVACVMSVKNVVNTGRLVKTLSTNKHTQRRHHSMLSQPITTHRRPSQPITTHRCYSQSQSHTISLHVYFSSFNFLQLINYFNNI